MSNVDVAWWISFIRESDDIVAFRTLEALRDGDHGLFLEVVHRLLQETDLQVQEFILSAVGELGDRPDATAESAALAAMNKPELREVSFLALETVGLCTGWLPSCPSCISFTCQYPGITTACIRHSPYVCAFQRSKDETHCGASIE
jgi:hypothetical protein